MPNWCYNKLTVSGDADQMLDFATKCLIKKLDKIVFDFNGTVPMPEEVLNINVGSSLNNAQDIIKVEDYGDWSGVNEKLNWPAWIKSAGIEEGLGASDTEKQYQMFNYMKSLTSEKDMEQARQIPINIEKYGFGNWYDWSCANWGTKWNASYSEVITDEPDNIEVSFDTAWSPPISWVMQTENLYPKLSFTLEYEEGGMGFKGVYVNGVVVDLPFEHEEEEVN